jgi:general nucleoside transport system ATP-binding protein
MSESAPAVSFRGITKRYGNLLANDAITFDVRPGTVHVLLGENGAGKTTLLSILTGFVRPDAGEITLNGRPLIVGSPRASLQRGIGFCAQHFLLAGELTGAENVLLGRPGCVGWRGLPREGLARIARIAAENGLEIPLDRRVLQMSIPEQERLEILKLLERESGIIVLDEPTSVLAPPEVGPLFETLRRLAREGRTVILVTHRLSEVEAVADRVTVLRRGRVVGEGDPRKVDTETLVRWIAGEDVRPAVVGRGDARGGGRAVLLDARGLSCGAGPSAPRGIDLTVRAGEIVGIGGVLGNGQNEIVEALTGRIPLREGTVDLLGQRTTPPGRIRLHDEVAWIPEDRRGEGIALEMTLAENLRIGMPAARRRGAGVPELDARRLLEAYDVRPPDPSLRASQLSGGNQQRLLLAREMARGARLILAVHPTRGLDPAATAFVHGKLIAARDCGVGILLVTGDLAELRRLSDRLVVLFRGRVRYEAAADQVDPDAMNRALVGV